MNLTVFYFLAWTCGLLPYMAVKSAFVVNRGEKPIPPFKKMQTGTLVMLTGTFAIALATARSIHLDLFHAVTLRPQDIGAGLLMLTVALGSASWRFRLASPARRERLLKIIPQQPNDIWLWAAVSLAAGVFEEVIYRGVMFAIFNFRTGFRWWPAVLICTAVFAVSHAIQGWKSAMTVGAFALAFHGLVWFTGTLYVAMAVHAIYDFSVGIIYPRLAKKYPNQVESATA